MNIGDLVYLVCDRNKHQPRPRYIVASRDGQWLNLKKFTGSQLRSTTYRVKQSECYKVPQDHVLDTVFYLLQPTPIPMKTKQSHLLLFVNRNLLATWIPCIVNICRQALPVVTWIPDPICMI